VEGKNRAAQNGMRKRLGSEPDDMITKANISGTHENLTNHDICAKASTHITGFDMPDNLTFIKNMLFIKTCGGWF
jgi:hypothetical protein